MPESILIKLQIRRGIGGQEAEELTNQVIGSMKVVLDKFWSCLCLDYFLISFVFDL